MADPKPAPAPKRAPAPAAGADPGAGAPEPTHDLLLEDGRTVPSYGAVPTHYSDGEQVLRVVHVTER